MDAVDRDKEAGEDPEDGTPETRPSPLLPVCNRDTDAQDEQNNFAGKEVYSEIHKQRGKDEHPPDCQARIRGVSSTGLASRHQTREYPASLTRILSYDFRIVTWKTAFSLLTTTVTVYAPAGMSTLFP